MESSQLQRPRAHNSEYQPTAEGEYGHHHGGEDEHHHEHGPKAVIKKVKQKAKKIKQTLTKHGHGHEHHDAHDEDDNDEDEEEPEVHGAPMYESAASRGGISGPQSGVNLEKPTTAAPAMAHVPPPYAAAHEGGGKQSTVPPLDEDPHAPRGRPAASNYESKVSDPTATAGEEAGMGSLLHSMDKIRVQDEKGKQAYSAEGSHDQSKPEPSCVGKASSAITDKAIAAKNVVASKLGYGGEEAGTDKSSNASSVGGYGNKIASSVAGTLAPVYGKVAGVGSTVMSKVSGGGAGVGEDKGGSDKGGVSVKEYLVEKLRPSEEDKQLSEVITKSMYKDKEEDSPGKEEEEKREKPMGKVTESEEVRKRLGTDKDEEKKRNGGDGASADSGAAGQAVVDRVKGWFGMGSPNSQPSSGTTLAGKKEGGSD